MPGHFYRHHQHYRLHVHKVADENVGCFCLSVTFLNGKVCELVIVIKPFKGRISMAISLWPLNRAAITGYSAVTGQLADAIGDFACLVFLFGSICETASCSVRQLAYPRVVQLPILQCSCGFFFFLFFLADSQRSQIGCLYHTSTINDVPLV